MIIKRWRSHKINTGNYESIDLGSAVEVNTEEAPYKDMELDDIYEDMSGILDEAVDSDVNRALKLPGVDESHVWDFYNK